MAGSRGIVARGFSAGRPRATISTSRRTGRPFPLCLPSGASPAHPEGDPFERLQVADPEGQVGDPRGFRPGSARPGRDGLRARGRPRDRRVVARTRSGRPLHSPRVPRAAHRGEGGRQDAGGAPLLCRGHPVRPGAALAPGPRLLARGFRGGRRPVEGGGLPIVVPKTLSAVSSAGPPGPGWAKRINETPRRVLLVGAGGLGSPPALWPRPGSFSASSTPTWWTSPTCSGRCCTPPPWATQTSQATLR
jgi:hypothetical protein